MLPVLPVQPVGVPWPTLAWPRAAAHAGRDAALAAAAEPIWQAGTVGDTYALLLVQGGAIVYERYAPDLGATSTLHSWSMAKSITHALCGLLVADGELDIDLPLRAREWTGTGDRRARIAVRHLLAMRSGLEFAEEYFDEGASDVMEMLWGAGKDDVAGYAAMKPALHEPGTHFSYSSGDTNIVCRHLGEIVGGGAEGMGRYLQRRLFGPLGMASATPKFDRHGTFKGSSFCFCTAHDFARFGLFYLRDGHWDGHRLLPEGWVDGARALTHREAGDPNRHYGLHWWINDDETSFYASGFEGQRILVDPLRDVVAVRLGRSTVAEGAAMHAALLTLVRQLPTLA